MSKFLSFEYEPDKEIRIHIDRSGAKLLINALEGLLHSNTKDHTHLMTESWGGDELTDVTCVSPNSSRVEMVTLHFWPNGQKEYERAVSKIQI
jgi:hypothetical protein